MVLSFGSTCKFSYTNEDCIGHGAFGSIYQATITERGNFRGDDLLAVKVVHVPEQSLLPQNLEKWEKFIRRSQKLLELKHEHLVPYHKISTSDTRHGKVINIVMDYCNGHDLARLLKDVRDKNNTLEYADAIRYAVEITDGLQFLHANHIIHGDLKPANVLPKRQNDGQHTLLIGDLDDCVQMHNPITTARDISHYRGTVSYMSPEMLRKYLFASDEVIGRKTDVWSLGCIIAELLNYSGGHFDNRLHNWLSGETFDIQHDTPNHIFAGKIVDDFAPYVHDLNGRNVGACIEACFFKQVERRTSASELLKELQKFDGKLIQTEMTQTMECALLSEYNKLNTVALSRSSARCGPSKKMLIRPIPGSNVDERFLNDIWSLLTNAKCQKILRQNENGIIFRELYRNGQAMALHEHATRLYEGLKEVVRQHLNNKIRDDVLKSSNDNIFLATLSENWKDHTNSMMMIRDILMYMDCVYVNQNNMENVYNLGLILFREHVAQFGQVLDKLRLTMLDSIARERRGETIDRSSIKKSCQMLMERGIQARDLNEEDFERRNSELRMRSAASRGYVQKVEQRLPEETERAKQHLDSSSEGPIIRVIEEELIVKHVNTVVLMWMGSVVDSIQNQKYEHMARMFQLFSRVPEGAETMLQYIGNYLADQGTDLVTEDEASPKNPVDFVISVLTLKDDYDKFLEKSFGNDIRFETMISNAFEKFLNLNRRSPEYLSLFIDEQLKKRNIDVTELENVLERVMVLFRFLQEKEVFERYYAQHLAKRLLFSRSTSNDSETMMIAKLKQECADQFTSILEGMLKDNTFPENIIKY